MNNLIVPLFLVLTPVSTSLEQDKKPNKEDAVAVLTGFAKAIHEKDYDNAMTFIDVPDELKDQAAKLKEALSKLPRTELSLEGVKALAEKGKWDRLSSIQEEREANRMARKRNLEKCFGLFFTPRQGAAFYWNGQVLRITYFNNIGRIANDDK